MLIFVIYFYQKQNLLGLSSPNGSPPWPVTPCKDASLTTIHLPFTVFHDFFPLLPWVFVGCLPFVGTFIVVKNGV